MTKTYASAGVNIESGDEAVNRIKDLAKSTFNENVMSGIGHFGAFYKLDLDRYKEPVMVSSVDGVGTKLKIAFALNKHKSIGQDLVNHCVNDIAVCGAKPLFFMDYLSFGKLDTLIAEEIVEGMTKACRENDCSLIGGETAEMPGFYKDHEYDVSGTIVGIVERSKIIDGNKIKKGDVLVGFPSNGLHTNGFSLARKVLLEKYILDDKIDILNSTLGDELLRIHRSYLSLINLLTESVEINGMAHITGGGILGNTSRIVPEDLEVKINWGSWQLPPIFQLIQEAGNITNEEMRKVFNVGIGLIIIVPRNQEELLLQLALELKEQPLIVGEIV